ncbi:MAG: GyrI-like domain-containing protein [Anaerolineales bacterium]|nr:GyrI-like domain-containing protein [Anaerolineales bacterium]
MLKLELHKDLKYLYQPSAKKVEIVEVPRFQFAMLDGQIEPGQGPSTSASFQEALTALYGISYTLKFTAKQRKENPIDYPVMALEGLWWIEGGVFDINVKDNWLYTLMMLQPNFITPEMFEQAREQVRRKRGDSAALTKMRFEPFEEGLCVQVMHIGPYADEPATVERMKSFARENGCRDLVERGGKHHEIYLGDPRRADPEKLKTILRHPIEKNV